MAPESARTPTPTPTQKRAWPIKQIRLQQQQQCTQRIPPPQTLVRQREAAIWEHLLLLLCLLVTNPRFYNNYYHFYVHVHKPRTSAHGLGKVSAPAEEIARKRRERAKRDALLSLEHLPLSLFGRWCGAD